MKKIIYVLCLLIIPAAYIRQDALNYHSVIKSNYETPWFSNDWFREPYTMFMLSGNNHRDYWTKNAVGDDWYVREITHKNKKFWTILKKIDRR